MRVYAAAALLLLGTGLTGCTGGEDEPPVPSPAPPPSASASPTPLDAFDSTRVTVARAGFCGLVPADAIEAALGANAVSEATYGNGQRAELAVGLRDVAHEYGCTWTAADGTQARAWVFAPPVPADDARTLSRTLGDRAGCTTPDAPAFGRPSVATLCRAGRGTTATYAGLFVDAWLSCSLRETGPRRAQQGLLRRTGLWCVDLATALDTGATTAPAP